MGMVESVPGFPYAIVVFDSNIVELLFERNLSHSELAFCMKYFPVRRDQSLYSCTVLNRSPTVWKILSGQVWCLEDRRIVERCHSLSQSVCDLRLGTGL